MNKVFAVVLAAVAITGCSKDGDRERSTSPDPLMDLLVSTPSEEHRTCVNGIQFSINRKVAASDNWPIYDEFYRLAKSEETLDEALNLTVEADGSRDAIREMLYARPDMYARANIDSVSPDVFLWGNYQFRDINYAFNGNSITRQQSTHCVSGGCTVSTFPMDAEQSYLASALAKSEYSECDLDPEISLDVLADDTTNSITVAIDKDVIKERDNSWREQALMLCSEASDSALCNDKVSIETYKLSGGNIILSFGDAGVLNSYLRDGQIKKSYEIELGEKQFLFAHLVTRSNENHIIMWQYNTFGELTTERPTAWALDEIILRQPELLNAVFDIPQLQTAKTVAAKISNLPSPSHKTGKTNYFEGENDTFSFTQTFSTWNEETRKLNIYHTLTELEELEKTKIANGEDAFFILIAKKPPASVGNWNSYPYVWVEIEFNSNDIQKENIKQISVGSVGVKQGGSTTFAEIGTQIKHVGYENQKVSLQYSGQRVLSGEAYSWNFDY